MVERLPNGVETKLAQDIKRIDLNLSNLKPTYDQGVDIRPEAIIQNRWFSAGRSYIKGLLCILAYKRPLSFLINTMKTHLIGDLEEFGIWDNDYDKFYKMRAKAFSKELEKRLILGSADSIVSNKIEQGNHLLNDNSEYRSVESFSS